LTAGVLSKDGDDTGDELLARFFRRDIGDGFLALSSRLSHINRSFGEVSASSSGEPVGFTKSFQLSRGLGVTYLPFPASSEGNCLSTGESVLPALLASSFSDW
jgi:hypothetical protein